jgi:hypothetical protein
MPWVILNSSEKRTAPANMPKKSPLHTGIIEENQRAVFLGQKSDECRLIGLTFVHQFIAMSNAQIVGRKYSAAHCLKVSSSAMEAHSFDAFFHEVSETFKSPRT